MFSRVRRECSCLRAYLMISLFHLFSVVVFVVVVVFVILFIVLFSIVVVFSLLQS